VLSSADVEVVDLTPSGVVDATVSKQHLIHLLRTVQELLGISS
jgi:hypothetical protein